MPDNTPAIVKVDLNFMEATELAAEVQSEFLHSKIDAVASFPQAKLMASGYIFAASKGSKDALDRTAAKAEMKRILTEGDAVEMTDDLRGKPDSHETMDGPSKLVEKVQKKKASRGGLSNFISFSDAENEEESTA
jgi:hypothetical protein